MLNAFKRILKSEMPHVPSKVDDLLAFRSIITMLSYIQSNGRLSTEEGPIATGTNDYKELRLLDALSAVLVREHEITAVVAQPYDGSNLRVFASVIHPSNALLLPNSDHQSLWSRIWNFTIFMNPRVDKTSGDFDSMINNTSFPLIGDYEEKIPEDLVTAAKENAPVFDTFLDTHW